MHERIGYLPENPYFYDYLTAREFLKLHGQLYGVAPSKLPGRMAELGFLAGPIDPELGGNGERLTFVFDSRNATRVVAQGLDNVVRL